MRSVSSGNGRWSDRVPFEGSFSYRDSRRARGGANTFASCQSLAAGAVSTSVGLSFVKCTDDTLGTKEGHP